MMPAQATAEMPTSPTPTPMPIPAPVDIPPLLPVSEEREPAASDVWTAADVPDVVCVDRVLLAVSDAVAEVVVDVSEVELLVVEVVEEDVEEETVGGSSAVILKYADDTLGTSMLPWFDADPLKIQKKKTLDQSTSNSYRLTVQVKELWFSSVAALPACDNMISRVDIGGAQYRLTVHHRA